MNLNRVLKMQVTEVSSDQIAENANEAQLFANAYERVRRVLECSSLSRDDQASAIAQMLVDQILFFRRDN